MKNKFVLDTMALVLRLEKRKLSREVKDIFIAAETGDVELIIPIVAVMKIGYLSERGKIEADLKAVESYHHANPTISIAPLTFAVLQASFKITDIPELHDRLIAGTAANENLSLLSNDQVIKYSQFVKTVW